MRRLWRWLKALLVPRPILHCGYCLSSDVHYVAGHFRCRRCDAWLDEHMLREW